jgi:eukaryotic-like serine/threonine-protein kinase
MVFAGRYRIVRRLGRGGMASVFLAVDERLAREVAVKRLHADSPEDAARRFHREARIGATLNHPNLVAVYDAVADGESVLIVMEYVPGRTLNEVLAEGPLEVGRAVAVLRAVAAAIDHAHQHGIVHRDIKPANVLLRGDGQVKLADLGVAKALEDSALTDTNIALGTPTYMAPEQLAGERTGPASDVYSLGLIAFEALSGQRARTGATPVEHARQAELAPPPDLHAARPDLPVAAAEVLRRALDRDPGRRPASASAFVRELERALQTREHATRAVAPAAAGLGGAGPRRAAPDRPAAARHPARAYAVAGLVAVAAAILAVIALAGGGDDDEQPAGQGESARQQAESGGGAAAGGAADAEQQPASAAEGEENAGGTGGEQGSDAAAPAPGDPAATVQRFYELAAAGETKEAWKLASGNFRSQLQGYSSFESQQATLESVEFSRLDTVEESEDTATVTFADTATHTGFVDECTGTFALVAGGDAWLIDEAVEISCERR